MKETFRERGYIVLSGFISTEKQSEILHSLRALFVGQLEFHDALNALPPPPTRDDEFFDEWVANADHVCHDAIRAVYESIFDTPALQSLFWDPSLLNTISSLLDVPAANLFLNSNRLRIDPPGPNPIRLGWHQESSYTRSRASSLQFWGPLLWPSSETNGGIEIAPGSHKNGNIPTKLMNPGQPGARQYTVPQEIVEQFPTMFVEASPGDLVLFSCDLFHRSFDPARQKRMKYSLVSRYTDFTSPSFSPFGPAT